MRVMLLGDTLRAPLTGIGRYTLALRDHLLLQGVHVQTWKGEDKPASSSTGHAVRKNYWRQSVRRLLGHLPFVLTMLHWSVLLRETIVLKRASKDIDVLHGPNYHVPKVACARVVTIHDLSVFSWSDCHPADRVARMRPMIRKAVQTAHRIITDAEFNRQELIKQFGLSPERVISIPLACDSRFHQRTYEQLESDLSGLGLAAGQYVLFVGTVEPRKNLDVLLAAWGAMNDAQRAGKVLVVAGGQGWRSNHTHEVMLQLSASGLVKYLGYVPDDLLPALYAGAAVFAFPSHYEGFGLPVLEAMASGVPVISSPEASLPEVGGDAVVYADVDDITAWQDKLTHLLSDAPERARLAQAGLARAAQFSWSRLAEQTHTVYAEAMQVYRETGQ